MSRKLRMGMVGGSLEAFIGGVHRIAAAIDGQIELTAGAFSSNPEKSKATGKALFLPDDRVYASFEEMIATEKSRPAEERIDFISIVTPNHLHYAPAKMALENGFHVICDKPMTINLEQAESLQKLVEETGLIFALTHNYTGYPMVKQAKAMIANGEIGTLRKIIVEYPQGWLSSKLEGTGNKQASWRTNPDQSGAGGGLGDIGTHAENLAEYVTGSRIKELCADLSIFVDGRPLDDDGNILIRFDNGAKGILQYSQVANGEENSLSIRVYGETGGLEWRQMEPNSLVHKTNSGYRVLRTNWGQLYPAATAHARIPAGHPEGFLEAFANVYRNFAFAIRAHQEGKPQDPLYDFPTVKDGVRGLRFIDAAIQSGKTDTKWTKI
ncbi:Gfo/Idh/MocA family oxidoreductase [Ravibacter arvi]|uniref:Gfo/Idh/MocA family oxidoreductase n=1 Tax=Ravibacter arvi TaxID=2051041 RepID=A0ABP8M0I0_9BACT